MIESVKSEANLHSLEIEAGLKLLSSTTKGLTSDEAKKRIKQYGPNDIQKGVKTSALGLFLNQFKDPLLILLILAGVLSISIGEAVEGIAMFAIVLLNAVLGFVQEYRAEKAMEALQRIAAPMAMVLRDGVEQRIPSNEIVPGDVILLEAGGIAPADARLIEVIGLQVDESSLTGESLSVEKSTRKSDIKAPIAEQHNMTFMGTVVTYGRAKALVLRTGMQTEFGKISASLQATKQMQTPLQKKFDQLARQIGIAARCPDPARFYIRNDDEDAFLFGNAGLCPGIGRSNCSCCLTNHCDHRLVYGQ
jgi:Ca2+-transporting ATPase